MKYTVRAHARQRFIERFRNSFHPSYFTDRQLTDSLIEVLITNAKRITWWESVPFYVNKVYSKHGPTFAMQSDRGPIFLCQERDGSIYIKTVVRKFDPRYGK